MRDRKTRTVLITLLTVLLSTPQGASAQEMFWDNPRLLESQGVRYSQSAQGGGIIAVSWQEIVPRTRDQGDIFLSLLVSRDGRQWRQFKRFFASIPYNEPEPDLHPPVYSMVVDRQGRIVMAVTVAEKTTAVIASSDQGASFHEIARLETSSAAVTPHLFLNSRGGFLLFVTQGTEAAEGAAATEQAMSLFYSVSADGTAWSAFAPFVTETDLRFNFQPSHTVFKDRDFIVFQSRSEEDTYQLHMKSSSDGGKTWSTAKAITSGPGFSETQAGRLYQPLEFTNQRAFIAPAGDRIGMAWERNIVGARPQLYYCELTENGDVVASKEKASRSSESIFGFIVPYNKGLYVLYADAGLGATRIALARKSGLWDAQVLSAALTGDASSPHAVVFNDRLIVFWERASGLVELRPVTSVDPPQLVAADFSPGRRQKRNSVLVRWKDPPDPAGIRLYRYTWKVNDTVKIERTTSQSNPALGLLADSDGAWELSVTAEDFAGNVSPPGTIGFYRDTTPPDPVQIQTAPMDEEGYLQSNTFSLSWVPPSGDEVAGYTYGMRRLGAAEAAEQAAAVAPLSKATRALQVSFNDLDNGVWAFSVTASDTAGNVSRPSTVLLRLRNFIPFTAVYAVDRKVDDFGDVTLALTGRGFTTQGTIDAITLTSAGPSADVYHFSRAANDFIVASDTRITGLTLTSDYKSGSFSLRLHHPLRGEFLWRTGRIEFQAAGTVKIGNFNVRYMPGWMAGKVPRYSVPVSGILGVLVVAFLAILIVVSGRKMVSFVQEGAALRQEAIALVKGELSVIVREEREKKMRELQKRGAGLRLKFTLLIVVLVFLIVLLVAVPLYVTMMGRQTESLADGLRRRSEILIGSLATSAEFQLALKVPNYADMNLVPNSISAMQGEALWATITGPGETDKSYKDYVWASNDPQWVKSHAAYQPATEKAGDELAKRISSLEKQINTDADKELGKAVRQAEASYERYMELSVKADARSQAEATQALSAFSAARRELGARLKASQALAAVGSVPAFELKNLTRPAQFVFYKPIVFLKVERNKEERDILDKDGNPLVSYYQGIVRLGVSTERISKEITQDRDALVRIIGVIALAAIALGVLGAIILASITVNPIKKLVRGVANIRDTEDKEELKGKDINVRTRDEIGQLADTVNDMMHGLIKAAAASKDLLLGKDIQKMFLPLEKVAEDRKGTTGGDETRQVEIYGYYEGAKGVSGDYFDFKKLDETHYALIKCDVAGKGVPAALIMVEVATLFINYCREWMAKKEKLAGVRDQRILADRKKELEELTELVYTINDMLEERGFKGRFAAFTVCLFNTETGMANICAAGDKEMHLYKAGLCKVVQSQLPETPAAGVFPRFMVEARTPYKQVAQKLDSGDTLFLFTDGFEESNRPERTPDFSIVRNEQGNALTEEFGVTRIHTIIEAVFNRGTYKLEKLHNPVSGEELVFDFSSCVGTAKEAVLALVSVEKVFRLFRDPAAGADSKVAVDAKVSEFLKSHFIQYSSYFSHPLEVQGNGKAAPQSLSFAHLKEDDQYDDLTILVVRKK